MLRHSFQKSQCSTTQTLLPLHTHFLSAAVGNVASWLPKSHTNSLSKTKKLGLRRASTGVKAVFTSTKKSTTVKAMVTVLETVGGALTHLGLDRGLDDIADLLGRSLLIELVAAELDAGKYLCTEKSMTMLRT